MTPSPAEEPSSGSDEESLLLHRQNLTGQLQTLNFDLSRLRGLRADGFDDDEHDPDGMPLSSEIERQAGLIRDAAVRLSQIDKALAELGDGSYGLCASCGQRIAAERLQIRPTATHCAQCVR